MPESVQRFGSPEAGDRTVKIPSYDDLARSISDVHPRDTFNYAARLVPRSNEPVVRSMPVSTSDESTSDESTRTSHVARRTSPVPPSPLFTCLRTRGAERPGALMALAREFSPRIERDGDAAVVLDVSGLGRLLGDAAGIAMELARAASDHGLKVSIAVGPTATAVRLLTLQPGDPQVVTKDVGAAVAPLPLTALSSLAVPDPSAPSASSHLKLFDTLRRWGLRTVGEFAALPPDEIAARFGQDGLAVQRLARGLDPRPLVPDPGVPRFLESMELEWPIEMLEPLSFVLARLLDPLSLALERAGKGGVAIGLDLRLVDRTVHTRQLQLPAPMRDARVLRTLLLLDLESHPPAAGIDVVTVEIDPAPGRIVQFSLLERATPSPETLATLTARLCALVGETRCGSPVLLDTYRPDAFELRRFAPGGDRAQGSGLRAPKSGMQRVHHRSASVARFECVDEWDATAGHPGRDLSKPWRDDANHVSEPGARNPHPGFALRRFRPPVAIRVAVEHGRPVHVPIDRKGMPGGRVEQSAGPWRSSGDWWNASGRRWDRDEWDVEFADGTVCRIFQARDTGVWLMEGVID